ncbi:RNA polymerase subunit sigma [Streptomyces sp. NPDC051985]|uniref:RNA polymerase subunit sigma n=1 Tax=Streptomyces sp. NPDC051985 TaxID=3155807 RepID=UPI0034419507
MEPAGDTMSIAEMLDERRHLLGVAHWMLGSRVAAERATDEAYREWYGLSDHHRARIGTPRDWLTQAVGRISLARLDGVPEVAADAVANTGEQPERARTGPADHALRSLRARRAQPAPPRRQDRIVHSVRQACADQDTDCLLSLLSRDVIAFFDGGGKVRAQTRPVVGSERVARSLLTLLARHPRTTWCAHPVNGRTGLVARYADQVAAVVGLDVAGSRVVRVWVVLNPDKLRSWNRPRS